MFDILYLLRLNVFEQLHEDNIMLLQMILNMLQHINMIENSVNLDHQVNDYEVFEMFVIEL